MNDSFDKWKEVIRERHQQIKQDELARKQMSDEEFNAIFNFGEKRARRTIDEIKEMFNSLPNRYD